MSSPGADARIFVDTSAYYAAVDRHDASHAAVAAAMRELFAARRRLTTTNAVLFELHGLLLNRLGIGAALTLDRHFAQFGWVIILFAETG